MRLEAEILDVARERYLLLARIGPFLCLRLLS